jgi:crotonobetainyl-CoA:carnitine CoA-transferase CaiB-like acyl-CoA transferase
VRELWRLAGQADVVVLDWPAALLSFRRTGTAQAVVVSGLHAVSAMQAAVTVTAPGISSAGMRKVGMASLANYAPYRCADGQWLFLGALTEAFFIETLDVIGLMEVLAMPEVDGSFANIMRPEISAGVLRRMRDRFSERDRYWGDPAAPTGPCPGGPASEPELPLTGLNVIDASSFVAGTFAPSILAGYEASVVKNASCRLQNS